MSEATIGLGGTFEYSTEVPPTAASNWNTLQDVRDMANSSTPAPEVENSHQGSTVRTFRTGLADVGGTWTITCGVVLTEENGGTDESQAQMVALWQSGQQRWFRVTFEKSVTTSSAGPTWTFVGTVINAQPNSPFEGLNTIEFQVRVNSDLTFAPETRAA